MSPEDSKPLEEAGGKLSANTSTSKPLAVVGLLPKVVPRPKRSTEAPVLLGVEC